jgi:large subunit ribosomal protein L22
MSYQATHRFARISARKVRPLTDLIRGQRVDQALATLRYQPQRGARMLEKLIHSALANDEDQRAPNKAGLTIDDARVDGGPSFKRLRPRARGMAHVIIRRTSHISVAVG